MYFRIDKKINEVKTFAEIGIGETFSTGIAALDEFVKLKKGFPLFIAGNPFAGKTEFTFEVLVNTSILYGWKHFIYCGEGGSIENIFYELIYKFLQKPYKTATEKEKIEAEYFIFSHFVIANHDKEFTVDGFYGLAKEAEDEFKIKFDTTTFDPFNDHTEDLTEFGGREDKYLASVLKKVRVDAKKNNRINILVNHIADIRPITTKDGKRYYPPALPNEWAGGRTWWRRAFVMLLVYRPIGITNESGEPFQYNETHIHIQKSKPKGVGKLGQASIFFDENLSRYYSDIEGRKIYSCEKVFSELKPNTNFHPVDFTVSKKELEHPF
jgi:hypothetical protein